MRNLLLVVLLVNILVLLWYNWIDVAPVGPMRVSDTTVVPEAPARHPVLQTDTAMPVCFLTEPLSSREVAETVTAGFANGVLDVTVVAETQDVLASQWVRLDNFPDSASARAAVAKLREAGLRDSYLMQDESNPGLWLVSLGIFRKEASITAIAAKATAQGYAPVVVPRYETAEVYRLQLSGAAPEMRIAVADAALSGNYLPCDP